MADVATPGAGALVLSQRAVDALGEFLGRFGQLLRVQTAGGAEFRYFYNITNLVKCVDVGRSEKDATGAITTEVFYDLNVPREPAVFKDPLTASTRLYVNDSGRELLEKLAVEAGLTGLECGEPRDYCKRGPAALLTAPVPPVRCDPGQRGQRHRLRARPVPAMP